MRFTRGVGQKIAHAGDRYWPGGHTTTRAATRRTSLHAGALDHDTGTRPTHGVWMNGVPLPEDAPSVARLLKERKNYRTALIGKAHFEPFLDLQLKFYENRMGRLGEFGPHRGFDHMELAAHGSRGPLHYAQWLMKTHPELLDNFYPVLGPDLFQNSFGGGDTGAVQVKHNATPRGLYHTDWVADRTIAYLDSLDANEDWFVWMSFPDPHHPWDPPQSEVHRHNWRDLPVPAGYPGIADKIDEILSAKPHHWRDLWIGKQMTCYEAPHQWIPASLTTDQLREIDAMTHIKNELIDEAVARVMARIGARGWDGDTDVIFSTDHGEFQGDFGLLFKGPHHVDSLMRLPLASICNCRARDHRRAGRSGRFRADLQTSRRCAANGWKAWPCVQRRPPSERQSSPNRTRNSTASRSRCARFIATAGPSPPTTRPRSMGTKAGSTT